MEDKIRAMAIIKGEWMRILDCWKQLLEHDFFNVVVSKDIFI